MKKTVASCHRKTALVFTGYEKMRGCLLVLILILNSKALYASEILVRGEQQLVLQALTTTKPLANGMPSNTMRWYRKPSGTTVGIGDSFFIQLADEPASGELINTLLTKYDLTLVKQYANHVYLLRSDKRDIISLINLLYLDDNTLDAYPNYYKKLKAR